MKIGFDFNGVIDLAPNIFIPLITLLRASGHEVGLVTGNKSEAFTEESKKLFDFTIFCNGPEEEMRVCGKVATTDEEKVKWWKDAIIKENKIDIMFDDYADVITNCTAIRIGVKK